MDRNEQNALAAKARSGDREAFVALYNEYLDRVYAFARKNVGNDDAAQEITAETFAAALENIGSLKSEEAFAGWLYSIAYKKCADHIRESSRSQSFDSDELLDKAMEDPLNEPVLLPDDYAVNKDTRRRLGEIIDGLSPDQRSAIILYYYNELSIPEVAKALGTNENNTRQKLFKARSRIKKQIEKLFGSGAMLSAVPLGAMLENTADASYAKAAAGAAKVKGIGLGAKIAAVGAAAAVAVGVPLGLGRLGNKGDVRPDESSLTVELPDESSLAEEGPISSNKLRWAVPSVYSIGQEQLDSFNRRLMARGYDFAVEFVPLEDDPENDTYYWALESSKDIDIAFSGFADTGSSLRLIRDGYFSELDELCGGNSFFDAYDEKLWDSVRVGGKLYTVPNAAIRREGISFVFNGEYFSDEELEAFDCKLSSLEKLLGASGVEPDGDDVILTASAEQLVQADGSVYAEGALLSAESGEAVPLFESPEMKSLLESLHTLADEGWISEEMTLRSTSDQALADRVNKGDFKLLITGDPDYYTEDGRDFSVPVIVRTSTPYVYNILAGSTGIPAASEHKAEALKLLELVYTDSELLLPLVSSEEGPSLIKELMIGSSNLSGSIEALMEERYKSALASPFIGFSFEPSEYGKDLSELKTQTEGLFDIWKENDLESALEAAQTTLGILGADELAKYLNSSAGEG